MTAPVFADIEAAIIALLTAQFGDVTVVGRVPTPRPTQFIRIERLGGPRETRVTEAASIAVEAWAGSDGEAAALLNTARSYLFDIEGHLFGVDEYGGPTRLPDPYSDMSRYTASFTVRAHAVQ